MTSLHPLAKSFIPALALAIMLGLSPQNALAQTLDSSTNLRSVPAPPAVDPSTGGIASGQQYPGNPGCHPTMQKALTNSTNFMFAQHVAVHINTVQQPTAFSSCIQGLLAQAQALTNMFSGIVNIFAQSALKQIITNLENQACADIKEAAGGIFGSIPGVNFANLLNGGIMISLQPTLGNSTAPVMPIVTMPTSGGSSGGSSDNGSNGSGGTQCPTGTTLMSDGSCQSSCPSGADMGPNGVCTCEPGQVMGTNGCVNPVNPISPVNPGGLVPE